MSQENDRLTLMFLFFLCPFLYHLIFVDVALNIDLLSPLSLRKYYFRGCVITLKLTNQSCWLVPVTDDNALVLCDSFQGFPGFKGAKGEPLFESDTPVRCFCEGIHIFVKKYIEANMLKQATQCDPCLIPMHVSRLSNNDFLSFNREILEALDYLEQM